MMPNSVFSVAGMSSSTSSHSPNLNTMNSWGSSTTGGPSSFGDSLSQSRSHYQAGYLMSSSQNNNVQQGSPRVDDVPTVQTKAKMNHMLSRGSASDFGMDSMFQSTRHRQTLIDEDAPPMSSVNDIPNFEPSPRIFQPKKSTVDSPSSASQQVHHVIVFGYPPDKYSVTVEYVKSLGSTTEADPHLEIANCFKIGFYDPGEALRVVRKNGNVLCGSFMIGVKWADPAQGEMLLHQSLGRSTFGTPNVNHYQPGDSMAVDDPFTNTNPHSSNTPLVGTPIRLAPSTSAFKQPTTGSLPASKRNTPQNPSSAPNGNPPAQTPGSPTKGLVGQTIELIFGW